MDTYKLSNEDIFDLNLLDMQELSIFLFIIADFLSYEAILDSKQLIYMRSKGYKGGFEPNIDAITTEAVSIYIIAKAIFTKVGLSRYYKLYNKSIKGEWKYSLEPNIDINNGNILGLIALIYLYNGSRSIYLRDVNVPIYGVI